ncbi:hypothetical protein CY34DRAFT_809773, partial [Suillus luteus UH-Slu-Lm8-n1]
MERATLHLRQPSSIYPMTTATKFKVHPLFLPSYFRTKGAPSRVRGCLQKVLC